MAKHDVKQLVFSSSCTVYGSADEVPISEGTPLKAVSPYGRTKLFQEEMFRWGLGRSLFWDRLGGLKLLLFVFSPAAAGLNRLSNKASQSVYDHIDQTTRPYPFTPYSPTRPTTRPNPPPDLTLHP